MGRLAPLVFIVAWGFTDREICLERGNAGDGAGRPLRESDPMEQNPAMDYQLRS